MKKLIIMSAVTLTVFVTLCLSLSHCSASSKEIPATPLLSAADLPGFYFYNCCSKPTCWYPWGKGALKGFKKSDSTDRFDEITERWLSVPKEKAGMDGGYYVVDVNRYVMPSKEDAHLWLKKAFLSNFFSCSGADLFEEGSYSGKKIGDTCFIFRVDKKTSRGDINAFREQTKTSKTLYFIKNNVAVQLHIGIAGKKGNKEVSSSMIENLAEIICSRL